MEHSKYPHSSHVYWSNTTSEDKIMPAGSLELWQGREVIISEKRDGEGVSCYREGCHARSVSFSMGHPSQTKMRALWGSIAHNIPPNMRICGESLTAKHAIKYTDLPSCFEVFSIWEDETILSWKDTLDWCELLGLEHVPVLWEGPFDLDFLKTFHERLNMETQEGYVVRTAGAFPLSAFSDNLCKFVRKGHVQMGSEHWREKWEYNGIREGCR